jgi:hypothetical protein
MFHLSRKSLACFRKEWLNVSGGGGHAQKRAPDTQAGERIVDLGLCQQTLGFGDFINIS